MACYFFNVNRNDVDPSRRRCQQIAVQRPWISTLFHSLGAIYPRVALVFALHPPQLPESISKSISMDQGRIAGGWHQLHYCCSLFRRLSRCNCSIFCRSHCKLHLGSDIFKRGHKCSANSTINIWVFWDFNNRTPWLWLFNWFCLCTPGRHRLWHLPHPVAGCCTPRRASRSVDFSDGHCCGDYHPFGTVALA